MEDNSDPNCSEACANCTCGKKQRIELTEMIKEFNLLCETKEENGKVVIDAELKTSLKSIQAKIIEFRKEKSLSEDSVVGVLDGEGNQVIRQVFLKQ